MDIDVAKVWIRTRVVGVARVCVCNTPGVRATLLANMHRRRTRCLNAFDRIHVIVIILPIFLHFSPILYREIQLRERSSLFIWSKWDLTHRLKHPLICHLTRGRNILYNRSIVRNQEEFFGRKKPHSSMMLLHKGGENSIDGTNAS